MEEKTDNSKLFRDISKSLKSCLEEIPYKTTKAEFCFLRQNVLKNLKTRGMSSNNYVPLEHFCDQLGEVITETHSFYGIKIN